MQDPFCSIHSYSLDVQRGAPPYSVWLTGRVVVMLRDIGQRCHRVFAPGIDLHAFEMPYDDLGVA